MSCGNNICWGTGPIFTNFGQLEPTAHKPSAKECIFSKLLTTGSKSTRGQRRMDPQNVIDLPNIALQIANSDKIGAWATAVLLALVMITLLRFVVKVWHWNLWLRRLFWFAYLFILPFSIYAIVHIVDVKLVAPTNASQAMWLERGGYSCLAIVLAMLLVEGLDIFVWKGLARRKFGQATPSILIGVSAFTVYLATAYIIAAVIFDIPVTGALVSSGIILGVIGLSMQNTISDIFSGIFISLERPFRIGDWIVTEDDRLGKVIEIDWRATRLLSYNRTIFVVPNSKIANSIIENRDEPSSLYGHYFHVHMEPEAPVSLVRRVLLGAVLSSPYVQSDPPPFVYLTEGNQRPYKYLVYVYFENFEASWRGNGDVQSRIDAHLKRAGLSVAGESWDVRHRPMAKPVTREPSIQQLMAEVHLFQSLTNEELEQLSQRVVSTCYQPGDIIIREGDTGDSLLVIITGLVDVTHRKSRGRNFSIGRLGIGQCIGEMSLLTGRPRSATVQAITDCEVVEIPKESMNELFEKRLDLVDELSRTMSERRAASELVTDRDPDQISRMSLQDIANRFGKRIRSFFRL